MEHPKNKRDFEQRQAFDEIADNTARPHHSRSRPAPSEVRHPSKAKWFVSAICIVALAYLIGDVTGLLVVGSILGVLLLLVGAWILWIVSIVASGPDSHGP